MYLELANYFTVHWDARSWLILSSSVFFSFCQFIQRCKQEPTTIIISLIFLQIFKSFIYRLTKSLASHSWIMRIIKCICPCKFVKQFTAWAFNILSFWETSVTVGVCKLENLFQILKKKITLILLLLENHFWYENLYYLGFSRRTELTE